MAEVGVFVGAEGGGGGSFDLHFLHDGFRCGLNVSWASPLKSYRFTIFHGICHSICRGRKSPKNSASDVGCVAHACLCGSGGCGGDGASRREARRGFVQAARGFRGGWRVFGVAGDGLRWWSGSLPLQARACLPAENCYFFAAECFCLTRK